MELKCQAEVRSLCITDCGLFKQMIEWKDSLKFEHDAYLITVKGVNPYWQFWQILSGNSSPVFKTVEMIHTSAVEVNVTFPSMSTHKEFIFQIFGCTQDLT